MLLRESSFAVFIQLAILCLLLICPDKASAQTTTFTYHGHLQDGGRDANGNYDFQFTLWDSLSGGTQQPQPTPLTVSRPGVAVSAGVFTVQLDFGISALPGADRFLEIGVRAAGSASFTTLLPRQSITSTPYAIRTLNATAADTLSIACVSCVQDAQIGSVAGTKVMGTVANAATASSATNATNAATATNATQLGGIAAGQFVQTSDSRLTDSRPPTAGSTSYIQNSNQQGGTDFNISGSGTVGGTLSAGQYNIGNKRILSVTGSTNLANTNTFVGVDAGTNNVPEDNANGNFNSFFGSLAGNQNTAGEGNSFFGYTSGMRNTGSFNSFFGGLSGRENQSGSGNSFFGRNAGFANTQGGDNSFFGNNAGNHNIFGNGNSFFGTGAGTTNGSSATDSSQAWSNSFFGASSGRLNDVGFLNSFFGANSGFHNVQGNSNTMLGTSTDVLSPNLTNATAIGANAAVNQNNSLVLGSINGVNNATADTSVGIGTTAPFYRLHVVDPGNAGLRVQSNTGGGTVASFGEKGSFRIDASNSGTRLIVREDGTVGIGLPGPLFRLDVFNPGTAGLRVRTDTAGGTVATFGGNGDFRIDSSTTSAGRLIIQEGGNVGIGTPAPNTTLDVAGNAFVRGSGIFANNPGAADLQVGYGLGPAGATGSVPRLALQPLGHIGGPWKFNARDDATKAYLDWVYGPAATGITQDSSGNVGIGESSPTYRLQVFNPGANGLRVAANTPGGTLAAFGGFGVFQIDANGTPAGRFLVEEGGNVGIGTPIPDSKLTVNGTASKPFGGSWATFSDERLKNIKGNFTPGLHALLRLQPIRYEYKQDNALGIKSEGEHIGFSAQQVQRIIPEAVSQNDKGYLLVNNDPILWTMLNAIKEQQAQIEKQQKQIDQLKKVACRAHRTARVCR